MKSARSSFQNPKAGANTRGVFSGCYQYPQLQGTRSGWLNVQKGGFPMAPKKNGNNKNP